MHTYTCIYKHIYIYIYTHTQQNHTDGALGSILPAFGRIRIYRLIYIYICIYIFIHIYLTTHVYTYICICTHTYRARSQKSSAVGSLTGLLGSHIYLYIHMYMYVNIYVYTDIQQGRRVRALWSLWPATLCS